MGASPSRGHRPRPSSSSLRRRHLRPRHPIAHAPHDALERVAEVTREGAAEEEVGREADVMEELQQLLPDEHGGGQVVGAAAERHHDGLHAERVAGHVEQEEDGRHD